MSLYQEHNKYVLGAVIAGGMSRRMGGQDKFLLSLNGKMILDHIIERFGPQVSSLILNINGEKNRIKKGSFKIVRDVFEESCGPIGGLFTVLNYARSHNFSYVVTVACDTPFLPIDYVSRLAEQTEKDIVIAKSFGRLHPTMGLWNVALLDDLEFCIKKGEYKISKWVNRHSFSVVCWDQVPDPFFNINSPEDLVAAENELNKSQL